MLDRPRVRRGRPAKRFFLKVSKPQRRGPLPDFRFIKPQIERERRNPVAAPAIPDSKSSSVDPRPAGWPTGRMKRSDHWGGT